jgi:hypothetical protein
MAVRGIGSIMGVAMLLTGVGFLVLTWRLLLPAASERKSPAASPAPTVS